MRNIFISYFFAALPVGIIALFLSTFFYFRLKDRFFKLFLIFIYSFILKSLLNTLYVYYYTFFGMSNDVALSLIIVLNNFSLALVFFSIILFVNHLLNISNSSTINNIFAIFFLASFLISVPSFKIMISEHKVEFNILIYILYISIFSSLMYSISTMAIGFINSPNKNIKANLVIPFISSIYLLVGAVLDIVFLIKDKGVIQNSNILSLIMYPAIYVVISITLLFLFLLNFLFVKKSIIKKNLI